MARRSTFCTYLSKLFLVLIGSVLCTFSFGQNTIFQPTDAPLTPLHNDGSGPIEVGVKFRADRDGDITGIRFYKDAGNSGTHVGNLWSSSGTLLATATFTGETSSGWQQVLFSTPVAITANTTYIASYFSEDGNYSLTNPYFSGPIINGPLHALAWGEDGPNGLFLFTMTSAFPTNDFQTSNYWVDVSFVPAPDLIPPTVFSVVPANAATGVSINTSVSAVFSEDIDPATISNSTFELRNASNVLVPATISYNAGTLTARLIPSAPLANGTAYTATLKGGITGIRDVVGNAMEDDYTWVFNTATLPAPPTNGHGGPIVVIGSAGNPFTLYPAEILRAEGLNEFGTMDISAITPVSLNNYDVAVLGDITVTAAQVTILTNWVNAGGTLIAFKPSALLAPLFGISAASGTLSDKYLLVNTASGPGTGIVNQTIQFHGTANLHTLNGATSIATIYSDATTATANPAVTMMNVGVNGGRAIAFTYDLPRSIVYTRQGNPAWVGMERDGQAPIRSNDLFFGDAAFDPQPDWIDFNKIAIPQADEQQRLLANIILQSNLHRKPLPRFWYLPKGLKAAIVMTGDDHGVNGTTGRFNHYLDLGHNTAQDVINWTAIRGTSYIYPSTPITNAQAAAFEAQGFEIALHPNTECTNFTPSSLEDNFSTQLAELAALFPDLSAPVTNRTHCLPWSDWVTHAKIQAAHGIRLDANYYYWPDAWIQNRAGMFTGSGMPMRFADLDGTMIDCYQAPTQMTDESGLDIATFCNAILDKALGAEGYYGVFNANMHTDLADHPGSEAILASAMAHQVPVISAKQMLTWLDGRNNSYFGTMTWNSNTLIFPITAFSGANNLKAMLPLYSSNGQLTSITRNGSPVPFTAQIIKGMQYAFFDVTIGTNTYVAVYTPDHTAPVITNVVAVPNADGTAVITWTTTEASDSRVDYGTTSVNLNLNASNNSMVTNHSITLTGLTLGTTYYFRVTSKDPANNSTTQPIIVNPALSFVMPAPPCAIDKTAADFNLGTTGANTVVALENDGAVILRPAVIEEFSGNAVPSGWTEGAYNPGATTFSNGTVTVNGTHISSNISYAPGTSIEFAATFNQGAFQNIGFTVDQEYNATPWLTIGQGSPDGNLYARSFDGTEVNIGSNLLGALHKYRITWNAASFDIYVDGNNTPAATINLVVTSNMFIQISDFANTDGVLSVDWLRIAPYTASGSFTSRIFDAGISKAWGSVVWSNDIPAGTSLAISVRTGNTANSDDGTWSAYTTMGASGASVGSTSRYIQYKADFITTNTKLTAALKDISIYCSAIVVSNTAPVVTTHPSSQSICAGSNVSFTSAATGSPAPTVQWQVSTNGTTWTNITNATNTTLTFTATNADDDKKYRAVWTNTTGTVNSNTATLNVKIRPSAPLVIEYNGCGYSALFAIGLNVLWSNGETAFYILTENPGTYSVTQTWDGCTSEPAIAVADPNLVPPPPTISVVSNCGNNAVLTAGNYTGSLDWSTGASSPTITVASPGTYSVSQTVGWCSSDSRRITVSPVPIPATPVITVVNNCGNSVLTASGYTGTLLWSNGATTPSITVTTAAVYTVKQTVNGCTSAIRSATAAPKAIPSTPLVTVANNCGSSVLTASQYTGSLLWSNGATTSSITVTNAAAYTVKQTVNGCASAMGSGTAAPKAIPATPVVTVVNNCGNSVLTASQYTGTLLWSNGATSSSITVTNAATYTVKQTVNGCTSATASGTVAPKATPSTPVVTVTNLCGSSVLTASGYTGTLLWSNGATTSSITVTNTAAYTVIQNLNGCISASGGGIAAPKAIPSTPLVTVTNNCGSSVLTASGYTGTLLWSNGATTSSITVTTTAVYTVRQTINGCTSEPGSGTAAPKVVPPAPAVSVANNCNGSSVLTASGYTGTLLWSNGATSASITVTNAATYTVKQTVNGCTSALGSGTSVLGSIPATPIITVVNNCGSSVLTASGYTGTLLWSNGASTSSITVTTAATYTVKQTVNGCTSLTASGNAAPKALPVSPTITVVNNCGSSVLTASNYTGALQWNNGATTASITVTATATYSVTQTLNGCASIASSVAVTPKAIPAAPTVTVSNLCGSSVLTANGYTGTVLWSNGATTAAITVTNAATYTVTQTVNGCTSPARSAASLPLVIPATPVITANGATSFCQGGSVTLSSSSASGNVWSNGATTQSIVVTASGSYTVKSTGVNGCPSANSVAKVVAVNPKPSLSSALTKTITSAVAFSYTPTSATTGATFSWSRAAITGISNPAASGSGAINETLVNTTTNSVNVTYVYTLSANGCTNTQNVIVTVVPAPVVCSINSSIVANFNATPILAGRYIWLSNVFDPGVLGTTGAVYFYVTNSKLTVTVSGTPVTIDVPNSRIRFDANVTSATTQFINNTWETQVPLSFNGNVFMGGMSYYIPLTIYGGLSNVTWSATISCDKAGVSIARKWATSVYTNFNGNSALNIKAVDGSVQNPYANTDKAGTPENYKQYVTGGGTGNGGTNYTGDYSATGTATCNSQLTRQSSYAEQSTQAAVSQQPAQPVEKSPVTGLDVLVMPNPSSSYFEMTIKGSGEGVVGVSVFDIFGRVMEKHEKIAPNGTLRLGQGWAAGTYFVEVMQDGQRKLVKIIKVN
jgi:hypothetical protein